MILTLNRSFYAPGLVIKITCEHNCEKIEIDCTELCNRENESVARIGEAARKEVREELLVEAAASAKKTET